MITIFKSMGSDLLRFFVLWFLVLFTLASAAFFLFNELENFKDLYSSFVVFFEASLGNWLLSTYDGYSLGDEVGEIYHAIVVIINMVLMLNLVIAILSETFARLSP